MADDDSEAQRLEASARKAFDAVRATVAGARKTAILGSVALGVVWLSGLEGTRQRVLKQERSFREINSVRQEAGRKIAAAHAERVIVQTEVDYLAKLKEKQESLPKGSTESLDYKIKEAWTNVVEAEKARDKLARVPGATDQEDDKAQKEIQTRRAKFEFLRGEKEKLGAVENRKKRLTTLNEASKAWGPDVLKAHASAKADSLAQDRQIDFELLGVKLKTPLLIAPVLWSVLLLGFVEYLILTRRRVVAQGRQGFRALMGLPMSGEAISNIAGTLPSWAAYEVTPEFIHRRNQFADSTSVEEQAWRVEIFGSKQLRVASEFLSHLIPLTALWLQFRVVWIGLELTRHLGSNRTRGVTAFALMLATGAACWLARSWFVFDDVRREQDEPEEITKRSMFWLLAGVSVILAVAIIVWLSPSLGIKCGQIFQKRLWFLWVLSGLWIAVSIARRCFFQPTMSKAVHGHVISRRNAIVIGSVLLLFAAADPRLWFQRQPRVRRRRKEKTAQHRTGVSKAGFYAKVRSRRVNLDDLSPGDTRRQRLLEASGQTETTETLISLPRSDSELPIVLHYVDHTGKIWAAGQFPRGPVEEIKIVELMPTKYRREDPQLSQGPPSPEEEHSEHKLSEKQDSAKEPPIPLISTHTLISGHFNLPSITTSSSKRQNLAGRQKLADPAIVCMICLRVCALDSNRMSSSKNYCD